MFHSKKQKVGQSFVWHGLSHNREERLFFETTNSCAINNKKSGLQSIKLISYFIQNFCRPNRYFFPLNFLFPFLFCLSINQYFYYFVIVYFKINLSCFSVSRIHNNIL
ncbi:hypothetical protein ANTQUA_LOCUS500 [Anthophora quadrimaculata]